MSRRIATGMSDDQEPRRLVFTKEDIEKIAKVLNTFLQNAHARAVLLVDKDGHFITREGEFGSNDPDTFSALVAGSFATIREMARLLGEKGFSVMLHQDKKETIHLTLVGARTILGVLFTEQTTAGMVRLYADQVASKLVELFRDIGKRGR